MLSDLSLHAIKFLRLVAKKFDGWTVKQVVAKEKEIKTRKRVKSIGGGYNGSKKEYREKVLRYWEKYGIKPKKFWYDLYCNGMDSYDPRFIPDDLWRNRIITYFNRWEMVPAYNEKCIYNRILPGARMAETIVKNVEGYYYDGDGDHIISMEEALKVCEKEKHLILKPSMLSKGDGIEFYDYDDEKTINLSKTFERLGKNFVVQRIIKQHPALAKLNESSLNTVRVLTFHFKGEVHFLSAQLRIGGSGARVDNVSAGGSAVEIKPDGRLYEKSVSRKSVWVDETPNGIKYKDICVPNFKGIIELCKQLHCQLPYFNIVGWDFAVGEDESPILVEYNLHPGQNQIGGMKPTFGDMTDDVLDEVFIKKTLRR